MESSFSLLSQNNGFPSGSAAVWLLPTLVRTIVVFINTTAVISTVGPVFAKLPRVIRENLSVPRC